MSGLHKIPTILFRLENFDPVRGYGYIYAKVKIPGQKRYVPKSLGHMVHSDYWDKANSIVIKGGKDAARINALIAVDREKIQAQFDADYKKGLPFTEDYIRSVLNPEASQRDFIKFFEDHVSFIKAKHSEGHHKAFTTALRAFKRFAGDSLPFSRIDVDFLEQYETHLRSVPIKRSGEMQEGLADNTVHARISNKLGEVIKKAIDRKYIDPDKLRGYKWPAVVEQETDYLTLEQVQKIWGLIEGGRLDFDPMLKTASCFFLVECTGGIRYSDWHKFEVETLISARKFKVRTTKNNKPVYLDLDIFKSLDRIVGYIASNNMKFAMIEKTTNDKLKILGGLIGTSFGLTTHKGRHTFGTLLGELGYTTRFISEAMAISPKTAERYIKITKKGMTNEQNLRGGF